MPLLLTLMLAAWASASAQSGPSSCETRFDDSTPAGQLGRQACLKRAAWLAADADLERRMAALKDPCSPRREAEMRRVLLLADEYSVVRRAYLGQVPPPPAAPAQPPAKDAVPALDSYERDARALRQRIDPSTGKDLAAELAGLDELIARARAATGAIERETARLRAARDLIAKLEQSAGSKLEAQMDGYKDFYRRRLAADAAVCRPLRGN